MSQKEYRKYINEVFNKIGKEVIDLFVNKKKSANDIAKIINIDKIGESQIFYFLKKNNICTKRRSFPKFQLNENYFEEINSHDKAYFLGFLLADGNVSVTEKKRYCIRIGLNIKDIEILNKFQKALNSNIPVQTIKRKCKNDECLFQINSKKMWNDLQKWEMKPRKSLTLKFPNIDKIYVYSLIRGYIDGDGHLSIYRGKDTIFHLSFISSLEFINSAIQTLDKTDIKFGVYKPHKYKDIEKNVYYAKTGNKKNIVEFLDKVYENDENWLRLERKYNIYLEMKKILVETPVNPKMIHNAL